MVKVAARNAYVGGTMRYEVNSYWLKVYGLAYALGVVYVFVTNIPPFLFIAWTVAFWLTSSLFWYHSLEPGSRSRQKTRFGIQLASIPDGDSVNVLCNKCSSRTFTHKILNDKSRFRLVSTCFSCQWTSKFRI